MYPIILAFHNILRWVVLILGVITLVRAYIGWFGSREWTAADRKIGTFFSAALDAELLLGVLLIILVGLSNLGGLLVDHVIPMFAAVVLVHIGSAVSRRAEQAVVRHRLAAILYSLAFLIILVSIPWWRPLFPGLTSI